MGAFKDSGHFWWQRCQQCRMAWFVGDKPSDVDTDETCAKCDAEDLRVITARDAALEEAGLILDAEEVDLREPGGDEQAAETVGGLASRIRALKSRPAERYIPESEVREALATPCKSWERMGIDEAARRLGVGLDAKDPEP